MFCDVRERERESGGRRGRDERDGENVGVCTGEVHAPSPADTYSHRGGGVVSFIVLLLCYLFS